MGGKRYTWCLEGEKGDELGGMSGHEHPAAQPSQPAGCLTGQASKAAAHLYLDLLMPLVASFAARAASAASAQVRESPYSHDCQVSGLPLLQGGAFVQG